MEKGYLKLLRVFTFSIMFAVALQVVVGCGGDTGGEGESFDGTAFDDNDASAGGITLSIVDDSLSVADTSGFRVRVVDAQGAPVPNIQIACDTEQGLALLEPTTGFELTDSGGEMSGRVGCESQGSYQIGCRLPVGSGKRSIQRVICSGPIPDGFAGFPGAGGGQLGVGESPGSGGAVPPANSGSVRASGLLVKENGSETLSIDVEQGSCGAEDQNGDGDTTDPGDVALEPFTDSLVTIAVKNETAEAINFSSFSYTVSGSSGSGSAFSSSELAFSTGGSVAANSSADLTGLFLKAGSGRKKFTGSSASISSSLGFRNVTFTLYGTTSSGKSLEIEIVAGLSFGNFNKCDAN